MSLNKGALKGAIRSGFVAILKEQSSKATTDGAESEKPEDIIESVCSKMADVVSEAVESYIKGGDIYVDMRNIKVVAPNGDCTVSALVPAKVV